MEEENAMLSRLETMINSKFEAFEKRISDNQKELSQSQISVIQENLHDNYVFKKKGHEQQYKVNSQVIDKLRRAEGFVKEASRDSSNEAADNAISKITEGIDILQHRQKCIKLADSSEHGWKVVHEYEAHPLADDSDDEKKIYRAQMQAERKVQRERRTRSRRYVPYTNPGNQSSGTASISTRPQTQSANRKPGSCFRCGKPGHWRVDCRVAQTESQSDKNVQISTFVSSFSCKDLNSGERENDFLLSSKLSENTKILNKNCKSELAQTKNAESPVGRLKSSFRHWQDAGAGEYILDIIQNGYKLPFQKVSSSIELNNNKSARDNASFVSKEIQSLLSKGCIREVSAPPKVINPLTVAINRSGKKRLVLDCRHLNLDLFKYKCCFENHSVARDIFSKGDYLFSFDIKGAYHHIMIFPEHTTYLGFAWLENGVKRYYVFQVLPFGISTAGFIFTKILRICVKKWREIWFKIVLFLDDGLGGASTFETAFTTAKFIRQDLLNFGFLLAKDKCHWLPCLYAVWLGYEWYMSDSILKVTEDRICRTEKLLDDLINQIGNGSVLVPVRKIACLIGQLISMQSAIGDTVRLRSRSLYDCVASRSGWNAPVQVSSTALCEIMFWKDNLRKLNMNDLETKSVNRAYVTVDASEARYVEYANVFVDASGAGFGGFIEESENSEVTGSWLGSESILSSTWRELESVYRVMKSHVTNLQDKKVIVHTDNKNATSVLRIGSNKPYLQDVSLKVNEFCSENNISLFPRWLPRADNSEADYLSRCSDSDDWSILDSIFRALDEKWGPHSVDRFACHYNAKCSNFNSRYWCPGTTGVDAFKQIWSEENNWIVPPPRLTLKCIRKILADRCHCTVVVPQWKSAPYWPELFPGGSQLYLLKTVFIFSLESLQKEEKVETGFLTADNYCLALLL
ncbi:uncharacterized protein LOC128557357 [Mercenaria mercenaria]|uniref:uncharacterized protein LOC128557357 n=1 Tax=Mercenaria mercenaria TaxID=6596 RepID=UPI00234E9629|nr:uncharacterized protein LOC128557357 [Mercenaria mercenaria]